MLKNTIFGLAVWLVTAYGSPDGVPARMGEFPHQVSLRFKVDDGLTHFCSGSIVDQRWVVTAAGCCVGKTNMNIEVKIVAGAFDLNQPTDNEHHSNASKLIIHPEFDPTFLSDDICMIQTEEAFEWSSNVQPIGLPRQDSANPVGIPGVVTGWETGIEEKSFANPLMKVNATVVTNWACNDAMLGQMICTDYPRTHQANDCTGDMGGPFSVPSSVDGSGRFTLLGIVLMNRGCGTPNPDDYPEVYLKASHYTDWIRKTMEEN